MLEWSWRLTDTLVWAQSSNTGAGFPIIDTLIVLVGVGGAVFAVCRSANRR